MTYLVAYFLFLLLPGFVLVRALGLRTPGALLAMPLSYLLVTASMMVLGLARVPLAWTALPVVLVTLLAAAQWYRRRTTLRTRPGPVSAVRARPLELAVVPLAIVAACTTWLATVGTYDEVPADAWWHLGRFQESLVVVAAGESLPLDGLSGLLAKETGYWYLVHALLCHYAGLDIAASRSWLTAANTAVLLVTLYFFALHVLSHSRFRSRARTAAAVLAVLFFVLHFGISVFAYTRYYVYGPAFLNLATYFCFTWVWLRYLRATAAGHGWLIMAALLLLLMAAVHVQEALFAVVTAMLTALIVVLLRNRQRLAPLLFPWRKHGGPATPWRTGRPGWLLLGGTACWLVLHVTAHLVIRRHDPRPLGYLVPTDTLLPFLENLYVVDPLLQFYQVVTMWGIAVCILFLLWRRIFRGNPFLWAGMLSPLFTVLNPVFIDLFLRFSWPAVAWRMTLLMPLWLVAGAVAVVAVRDWQSRPVAASVRTAIVLAVLAGGLAPIDTTYLAQPFSRVYTLTAVSADNDHRQWLDLVDRLRGEGRARIVTDPVTGYVINGLTHHKYPGYKFTGYGALPVNRSGYDASLFRDYAGGLVVINLRNGAHSPVGALSRHWPGDVLKVSTYYSTAFRRFVAENPDLFTPLWRAEGISVYRVADDAWWREGSTGSANEQWPGAEG